MSCVRFTLSWQNARETQRRKNTFQLMVLDFLLELFVPLLRLVLWKIPMGGAWGQTPVGSLPAEEERKRVMDTQSNIFYWHIPVIYFCQLDPYSQSPFGTEFLSGLIHWWRGSPPKPISTQPQDHIVYQAVN